MEQQELLSILENSRTYTIAVAEAMPEGLYNFKPEQAGWNFRELLHHVTYGIWWWQENYIKSNEVPWDQPPAKTTRPDILAGLNYAYNSLRDLISSTTLNGDSVKGFHATIDHITHHRGQAVVYLRCNAITPPDYTY